MKNNKKTLLILLLPTALTVYFIFWILIPSIQAHNDLQKNYKVTLADYNNLRTRVDMLKNNKKLLEETKELNRQTSDFYIQLPSEFEDEFLLLDFGKFSKDTGTKIISLNAGAEKEVQIKTEEKSKKKRGRRRKKTAPVLPLNIYEKTFDFTITGYYNKTINFVKTLENYQRKFILNGISAQISKNDEKNPNPKIELIITGSAFTAVNNPAFFNQKKLKQNNGDLKL